jgi:hypothetical protein
MAELVREGSSRATQNAVETKQRRKAQRGRRDAGSSSRAR